MKQLFRSNQNRFLSGVCGGLGNYFNIDPNFVRLGFVLATWITVGLPIIAYIVLSFIVPLDHH